MIGFGLLVWVTVRKLLVEYRLVDNFEIPLSILTFSVCFMLLSSIGYLIHYLFENWSGKGIEILKISSVIGETVATQVMIMLFIMLGYGWTLRNFVPNEKENHIMWGFMWLILNVVLRGLGEIDAAKVWYFHPYAGWSGIGVVFLRFLYFSSFVRGL